MQVLMSATKRGGAPGGNRGNHGFWGTRSFLPLSLRRGGGGGGAGGVVGGGTETVALTKAAGTPGMTGGSAPGATAAVAGGRSFGDCPVVVVLPLLMPEPRGTAEAAGPAGV